MSLIQPTIEDGRRIIGDVNSIIKDPSTIHGTQDGIGKNNVIIVILNSGTIGSYTIAKYAPGSVYPLECERNIHREQTRNGNNQLTSPDRDCWVIEGTQSFHDPYNTTHPHILVDGIHIIICQLPNFDNFSVDTYAEDDVDYGADDDGSSWGEGSVVSEGDLSEAGTASFVRDEGDEGYDFF